MEALQDENRPLKNYEETVYFQFSIKPFAFQQEILDQLFSERILHNHYKNLVVAATGTGKTVISAFDYKRFCEENPNSPNRLLFVAHREEILKQSLACFRGVLHSENFGELWVGDHRPKSEELNHLFISIQTFNAKTFQDLVSSTYYDFIIVDEFHHSAAPSYQFLLTYFTPHILLGLTATPERLDGKDIVDLYFDGRIAAEIRLPEAINRKLLSPFHYFGITDADNASLNQIQWKKGGYSTEDLDAIYLDNEYRVQLILDSLDKYLSNIEEVIGLGFCCSIKHAQYMAEKFSQAGISSMALTSKTPKEERQNAKKLLISKQIHFIFIVDLYNEGVDIPEVNTILFLRPTESLTVFLQQFGRGLRISKDKEQLTVLDYIGHAHKKYNFEYKFRALLTQKERSLESEIEDLFPHVPKGCLIELERVAQHHILENLKTNITNKRNIIRKIKHFTVDTGKNLTLSNFISYYGLSLQEIYKYGSWTRLCVIAGVHDDFEHNNEDILVKGILRLIKINSRRFLDFIRNTLSNLNNFSFAKQNQEEKLMLAMFYYTLWFKPLADYSFSRIEDSFNQLRQNPILLSEMIEIIDICFENIHFVDHKISLGFPCPLDLHCAYSTDQVLAAMEYYTVDKKPSFREGVKFLKEKNLNLLFVTLNKSEKEFSPSTMYHDYSISDVLFHWQSKSTTSIKSNTGQRYIHEDHLILLFVRKSRKEQGFTSPYVFLGPVEYVKHEGSKPINITWRLKTPMPPFLQKGSNKFMIS